MKGRRARHIIKVLRARVGDSLKTGLVNGPCFPATIINIDPGQVTMALGGPEPPPAETAGCRDLILALPRPIMLKRILSQIATLGVERLFIIRSKRVEKSFFSASLLCPEKIDQRLRQGLEQGGHTRLPQVQIFKRFLPFAEDFLPTIIPDYQHHLLAHPHTSAGLAAAFAKKGHGNRSLLAIGPEGGWVDFEVDCLARHGFSPFQMGPRILRVDSAVPALLCQLDLLHEMAGQPSPLPLGGNGKGAGPAD